MANVEDYNRSTRLLASTTLRNVLGTKNLGEILADRETIAHIMQAALDEATDPWGVKVERVEIKDVRLPQQLQRTMAAEAEATREAKAKVIAAEGEMKASEALKEASMVLSQSPGALQLRYLQTLSTIATEKNSTIIFPLPLDVFTPFMKGESVWKTAKFDKSITKWRFDIYIVYDDSVKIGCLWYQDVALIETIFYDQFMMCLFLEIIMVIVIWCLLIDLLHIHTLNYFSKTMPSLFHLLPSTVTQGWADHTTTHDKVSEYQPIKITFHALVKFESRMVKSMYNTSVTCENYVCKQNIYLLQTK